MAAVLVVVTLGVAASMAQGAPGRANLRASSTVRAANGRSVASANAVEAGGPAMGPARPAANTDSAAPAAPPAANTDSAVPAANTGSAAPAANTGSAVPEHPAATGPASLPDASPLPVLIVFDGSTITLTGAVPSDAAQRRLSALAAAYSQTVAAKVVNHLITDPRVPGSTGVRVIEMQAVRFAPASSEVSPGYAPGLGRVAAVMHSLPNLTVLVIGHADQRGDSQYNLRLSLARATAVVEYLITRGIGSDRLSAQGVGDRSPLTLQSDAAGLALNRRTEFVFFGLLAGG